MNTILIIVIIMMIFSSTLIFLKDEPTPEPMKAIELGNSNAVQEFYKCIQEGLISEEDISVKFVIDLSQQILNRLNRESDTMNLQMNLTAENKNVTSETSKLIEALTNFKDYEEVEQEKNTSQSINVDNITLIDDSTYKEENIINEVADVITEISDIINKDTSNNIEVVVPKQDKVFLRSIHIKAYGYNVYKKNNTEVRNKINIYA